MTATKNQNTRKPLPFNCRICPESRFLYLFIHLKVEKITVRLCDAAHFKFQTDDHLQSQNSDTQNHVANLPYARFVHYVGTTRDDDKTNVLSSSLVVPTTNSALSTTENILF